ncbi:hypothetical protein MASR2M78_23860 [Treponema sp.]
MLLYFSSLKNVEHRVAKRRLDEWLERFNLLEWKTATPEALSKGMTQKIQFIASILHDPQFIFLDEPFSGLDPVSTDVLREVILELGLRGKTILFTSHNMEVAEKICSRILIINKGQELISGSLADIRATRSQHCEFVQDSDGYNRLQLSKRLGFQSKPFPPVGGDPGLIDGADPQRLLRILS